MKLVQINDVYVDPKAIISAWPLSNGNFMFSVDQRSWTQQFEIETDEAGGWTIDNFFEFINEMASK